MRVSIAVALAVLAGAVSPFADFEAVAALFKSNSLLLFPSFPIWLDLYPYYSLNATVGGLDMALRLDMIQGPTYVLDGHAIPPCNSSSYFFNDLMTCAPRGAYYGNLTSDAVRLDTINYHLMEGYWANTNATLDMFNGNALVLPEFRVAAANWSDLNAALGLLMYNVSSKACFLELAVKQNITESRLYSIFFNNALSRQGLLMLGHVDPSLWEGRLAAFDIIAFNNTQEYLNETIPAAPLEGIKLQSRSGKNATLMDEAVLVVLDSRNPYTYLPRDVISALAAQTGATYVPELGTWLVDCGVRGLGANIIFGFPGVEISVPLASFVRTTYYTLPSDPSIQCYIAISPAESVGMSSLSMAFLNSAYVVVNYDSKQIALAQGVTDLWETVSSLVQTYNATYFLSSSSYTFLATRTNPVLAMVSTGDLTSAAAGDAPLMIPTDGIPYATSHLYLELLALLATTWTAPPGDAGTYFVGSGAGATTTIPTRHSSTDSGATQTMLAGGVAVAPVLPWALAAMWVL